MWGEGGRFYWRRRADGGAEGIVVAFGWLSSQEQHLVPYVELYSSLGWSSLVCHVDFLTQFFPQKAVSLAHGVLDELLKEVKARPVPIVLTAFSGGSKGCFYKVLQLIEEKCDGHLNLDEYRLVRECICGQIYDSSPVEFKSDMGTRFVPHPTLLKMSQPPRVVSWMVKAFASGMDTLFLNRFQSDSKEYWQALYSSVSIGPFLILCSEDDDLAPYQTICCFAQHIQELRGDVKLLKWSSFTHTAHYKYHQAEYKAAVTEMLHKAAVIYSRRRELNGEMADTGCSDNHLSESAFNLHEAAVSSNGSPERVASGPSDHFFLPGSMEDNETRDAGSTLDEQKAEPFNLRSINPHGVLGQILFDVCVPKNIEGWDIKPVGSLNGRQGFTFGRRPGPFNPIKCLRRSKL